MKKQQFMAAYEAPVAEVITLSVERGFGVSSGEGNETPGENPEGDWVLP